MTNKKENNKKNSTTTKQAARPETKIKKLTNDNKKLVSENKKLTEQIKNLINNVNELKLANEKSILSFQEKAKTFQSKAQNEVNRLKKELKNKLEKENEEFKKYNLQKTFESIIEPLLNIEIAIQMGKNQDDKVKAYVSGFEMLMQQLMGELQNYGLNKIEPKIGDEFDPELHFPFSKEKGEINKIIDVKKPGFKLYDRVIKPATVIIGK